MTRNSITTPFRSSQALNFSLGVAYTAVADNALIRPETTNKFTWIHSIYFFKMNTNDLPFMIAKQSCYTCIMGDQTNTQRNRIGMEVQGSDSNFTEYWGTTRLQPFRWYRIASTFDNVTGKHYIDGVAETMNTLASPYVAPLSSTAANQLRFGNSKDGDRNVQALISDVLIYNRALTAAEVAAEFLGSAPTSGLVAQYKLSEGTGASITDSSGNGLTGSITGAVWVPVTRTRGTATRSAAATRSAGQVATTEGPGVNLIKNPSLEVSTTGWNTNNGGSFTRITTDSYKGSACGRLTTTANDQWAGFQLTNIKHGKTYTWSAYVKGTAGETIHLNVYDGTADNAGSAIALTGSWQRLSQTIAVAVGPYTFTPELQVRRNAGDTTNAVLVDAAQVEESSAATTYLDGTLGTGYAWDGTANNSTSTRTARFAA